MIIILYRYRMVLYTYIHMEWRMDYDGLWSTLDYPQPPAIFTPNSKVLEGHSTA